MTSTVLRQRWLRIGYWTVFAALLLEWVFDTAHPEWPLLLCYGAFVVYLISSRRQLPERVASHFRFDLQADGWLARRIYLATMLGLTTAVLIVAAWFSFRLRQANQPFIARHLLRFDCVFLGFIAGIHALTVSANRDRESPRLSPLFWVLLAAFLATMGLWVFAISTHAQWGWPR